MKNETINAVEKVVFETAGKLYENGLSPAIKNAGGILDTLSGLVNDILLYKPKTWVIKYRLRLDKFREDFQKEIGLIPEENITEPKINIIGPALDILKYNLDEEDIKNIFLKLLSSSIDERKNKYLHPSYVQLIKEMDNLDAKVFKDLISKNKTYIKAINPVLFINQNSNKIILKAFPEWFYLNDLDKIEFDVFNISKSLLRLKKYGLIDLKFRTVSEKDGYEIIENDPEIQVIYSNFKRSKPDYYLKISRSLISITEYGNDFAHVCF